MTNFEITFNKLRGSKTLKHTTTKEHIIFEYNNEKDFKNMLAFAEKLI